MALYRISRVTLAICALLLAGCPSAPPLPPLGDATAIIGEDESRLMAQASEAAKLLKKSDAVLTSGEVVRVVEKIATLVTPPQMTAAKISVTSTVIISPMLNAFALPNGDFFITSGILCNAESEDEVATVVAHEVSHIFRRHSIMQKRASEGRTIMWRSIGFPLDIATLGVVGTLDRLSSISGFSKQIEQQADDDAFLSLRRAGFDAAKGARIFERLISFVADEEQPEPVFFSSHPKLEERIARFRELNSAHKGISRVARPTMERPYLAAVRDLCMRNASAAISGGHVKVSERLVGLLVGRYPTSAWPYALKGDLLRVTPSRGADAIAAYQEALARDAQFSPALIGLGRALITSGRASEAKPHLRHYFLLNPHAPERSFFKEYL